MHSTWEKLSTILKKLLYIIPDKEKNKLVPIFLMVLLGAIFETLGVSMIIPLMQAMLNPDQILEIPVAGPVLKYFGVQSEKDVIIWVCISVVVVYIIKNVFMAFLAYVRSEYACDIQKELSVKMMHLFMSRGYVYFLSVNTGDILKGIKNDADSIQYMVSNLLRIGAESLAVFSICIFVLAMDLKAAVAILFLVAVSLFSVLIVFRKQMTRLGHRYQRYVALVNKCALQASQGIKEILVTRKQRYFIKCYEDAYTEQQKSVIAQNVAAELPAYVIEAICATGMILFICIKIMSGTEADSFIPQLGAIAMAAFRILPSMGRISGSVNVLMYYCPAVESIYENFSSGENLLPDEEEAFKEERHTFNDYIELKDLHWKYPETDHEVIKEVNLKIKKGTSVALIGQSGAGKTTIADIILGLLKPQRGGVYVDGMDISYIPFQWSQMIGYIPQSIYLLDDTIRSNVAFGRRKEDIDDRVVWRVLEMAQLKEFVEGLPFGLDTVVGDRGVRFSGGQRQRIAIARALYYDPDIIVMDEGTSALDTETEEAVIQSLEMLRRQKTIVMIAHRLSTIKKCDYVYEVVEGKIRLVPEQERSKFM